MNDSKLKSLQSPRQLADAFSEFISASSLLETSYRDLQREVAHLGTELAERNAALTGSLAENQAMRGALQQMIECMPCGVLVLDIAERIVMINPEGRRLLDLEGGVVRTLRDVAALSRIDLEGLLGVVVDEVEQEILLERGEAKRWLAIRHRGLSGGSLGRVGGGLQRGLRSMWILRDVTATKEAEREREEVRSAMALAEVSAILAHEIRNPLASMELFAGLLLEEPGRTPLWVSHLRAGIRLLSATVDNVLSLYGGSSVHRVPIELSACVRGGVEFVRPIAEQAGVLLSFQSGDEMTIRGNENQIRQMLQNLICNAIRHTPVGGTVAVRTRTRLKDGGLLAIVEVVDTGCGISEQQMERVFEAGFSTDGNTPGLGLAVCRRLVGEHDGEIRLSSRVNCGSTFELEFAAL